MRQFVVAIDFDGTIVEHIPPEIGSLKEDAVRCIKLLKDLGCYIIITSCRTNSNLHPSPAERQAQKQIMETFLRKNNIPFDEIDVGDQGKIVADVYVDDRAIRFEDNWVEIVKFINLLINEE